LTESSFDWALGLDKNDSATPALRQSPLFKDWRLDLRSSEAKEVEGRLSSKAGDTSVSNLLLKTGPKWSEF
jgi:hypothetical protein